METKNVLMTIFGGTGDLARRKLYPSLFRLYQKGDLNDDFAVIGTARRPWSDETYHQVIKDSIASFEPSDKEAQDFASHFYYQSHNVKDTSHYDVLKELSDQLDEKYHIQGNRIFYLAMSPNFFGTIVSHLKSQGMMNTKGYHRVIIEKPFGNDYQSAFKLNEEINQVFAEDEIYRIDHYLGKEMIQNISAIRFANLIFESIWNNRYIDNIQISLAEEVGVEERAGYYDKSGALKDMVQNHILQMLSLLAMEPPVAFSEKGIRAEKIKALDSIRMYSEDEVRNNFVRGQYTEGEIDDQHFKGYRDEENVDENSLTETFVAGKFLIDNFRWSGVPFYIRTGKHLTEKGTRINIVFKQVPVNVFKNSITGPHKQNQLDSNVLTIYIQPTEGFSLIMNGKEIGQGFQTEPVKLEHRNSADIIENTPEAYEKLLLDVLNGDGTNFTHWDEVAQSWRIVDRIRQTWDKDQQTSPGYPAGTMGPKEAYQLLEKDGRHWIWEPDEWYRQRGLLK
ncbi:glucose-6-phosphate dehydrogenase [Tetragenococcus halophilus]|uniref:glucose-6-phosphate dehydrogenase n=1 Tax=Tetragenococcus halophilus TaxID=51669 RepID=UPI00209B51BA|nr:glucose-6-phosphate dehydrogenase [Tetragenococcus halophilus]MCO8290166.1 glucose-6-phosphate dehydrogenase [Tetragenococcus halophilus]MCO8294596.1 glucose-6-phosphate dehydrogenase [Tetragenococcus halophilus]